MLRAVMRVEGRAPWMALLTVVSASVLGSCGPRPRPLPPSASLRAQPGGDNEGPMGEMGPIRPSTMIGRLRARGIDPVTLTHTTHEQRDLVMQSFSQTLNVDCTFCHEENDFDAHTPRMRVAVMMWQKFVRNVQFRDGSPVYCDSCHRESAVFLRRDPANREALHRVMESYGSQLQAIGDPSRTGCRLCHSDPFYERFMPRDAWPNGRATPWLAPVRRPENGSEATPASTSDGGAASDAAIVGDAR